MRRPSRENRISVLRLSEKARRLVGVTASEEDVLRICEQVCFEEFRQVYPFGAKGFFSSISRTVRSVYCTLRCELEILQDPSDAANRKALKMSLFALRFAVNEAKNVSETGELVVTTAVSAAQALAEVRTLLAGGKVDKLGLDMYQRLLLALLPRNEKLARLMDIMELNIRFVDGANFSFRNYAYGFELTAEFALKKRLGDVTQTHIYR